MKNFITRSSLALLCALAFGAFGLSAAAVPQKSDAQKKGFEVSARSDRSDRGFRTSRVNLEMVLKICAHTIPLSQNTHSGLAQHGPWPDAGALQNRG